MSEYQNQSQENEATEELIINKETASNMDTASKKLEKGRKIFLEDENKTYFLEFKPFKNNNTKITLTEQDTFPAKSYEITLALEELKLKNEIFKNFKNAKELSDELNKADSNIKVNIKKKLENFMGLIITFPVEENNENDIDNVDNEIEVDLKENIIDDREMFRQIFQKYKSIQQEQNEDIEQFMTRIKKIEEILGNIENEKKRVKEKELEKEMEKAKEEEDKKIKEEEEQKAKEEKEIKAKEEEKKSAKKVTKKESKKEFKKEEKKEVKKEVKKVKEKELEPEKKKKEEKVAELKQEKKIGGAKTSSNKVNKNIPAQKGKNINKGKVEKKNDGKKIINKKSKNNS